jgi:hypothetical protein
MRRFHSYGPVDTDAHYYAPRKLLTDTAYSRLIGENPLKGGQYITVWAPRQTGKSWITLQVLQHFKTQQLPHIGFDIPIDAIKVDLDFPAQDTDIDTIATSIAKDIFIELGIKNPGIDSFKQFPDIFTHDVVKNPFILIIDEFDSLPKDSINRLTRVFRNVYMRRQKESTQPVKERRYMLHGLALIGVRSVLGIENEKGSPFNVQQSLHIPNLSFDEVKGMFQWYEKESGQPIHPGVIERLYNETNGQPGLTCWFGELLTEGFEDYKPDKNKPITMRDFEIVYAGATYALPNNNISNIISKADREPNKTFILEMFQTREKMEFRFDDKTTNSLYMNGVVDKEVIDQTRYYIKFSSPFVQKRLFNYFSYELFRRMGTLTEPFISLDDVITDTDLDIGNLLKLYRKYLVKNKSWLFKEAPRRSDLKIFEAVYHFNLFSYLNEFLREKGGIVVPEFPTGNGKIDLVITYKGKKYGIELKSYRDQTGYRSALKQAALYAKRLELEEIYLSFFVEAIDEASRTKYEVDYTDEESGVKVKPVFIDTNID